MGFRLAALALVLCVFGYGQENRRGQAARIVRTDRAADIGQDNRIRPAYPYRYGGMQPASVYTPDCSAASQIPPDLALASPEDFVELERSMCFGACPAYRVRLYRTGEVNWLPGQPVFAQGVYETPTTDPVEAAALLDRTYAEEFWSACESYPVAEDAPTYDLRFSIGGKRTAIQFGYDTGLDWLDAYSSDLDRIVDTHRRFHGDPATEDLNHISQEVSLSKRSMTPLMKAAARDDLEKISELLAAGAPVDEQDASGWTALMYAAGGYAAKAVSALLEAGANPNHTDLAGRTPLIASAHGRGYEEILDASRTVDHQSQAGLTALMVLARRANAEGVRLALANDAYPALTDARGQAAWDYLMQSYCGRILSPTAGDPPQGASADEAQQCFELDRLLKLPVR